MLSQTKLLMVCRALFGSGIGVLVGFGLYALSHGAEATGFEYWFFHPISNPVGWSMYGATMGMLHHLISQIGKNSN
jgi:hypothetical protein